MKREKEITKYRVSGVRVWIYVCVCVFSDYNIKSAANSKNSQLKFYIRDLTPAFA